MHDPEGAQRLRESADISLKPRYISYNIISVTTLYQLQHLCNTFNGRVQLCSYLPKHNCVASNVLHSKTLPYQSHISEAEEKTQRRKMQTIML